MNGKAENQYRLSCDQVKSIESRNDVWRQHGLGRPPVLPDPHL